MFLTNQIKLLIFNIPFFKGQLTRSKSVKLNILGSFVFQFLNHGVNFVLVPVAMDFLTPVKYGIWITITSAVNFFTFFDVGLGNGLKNNLSSSLAVGDSRLPKIQISTTYALVILIMGAVTAVVLSVSPWVNWTGVFNAPEGMESELYYLFLTVFIFFVVKFVLGLINIVFISLQRIAYTHLFQLISSIIALLALLAVRHSAQGSLLTAGILLTAPTCLVLTAVSWFAYRYSSIKHLAPSFESVDFKYARQLIGLGGKFFIIQINFVIIFLSDNLIITHALGPEAVVPYNIAFKYFSVPIVLFGIFAGPLWAAYANAYALKDVAWIKRTIRKAHGAWWIVVGITAIMLAVSGPVYAIWIGDRIEVPFLLSALMGVYVIVSTWGSIYTYFVNGVSKIKLQTWLSVFAGIINIPISFLLSKWLGSAGVILGTIICLFPLAVITAIQYKLIIHDGAKGIWNE